MRSTQERPPIGHPTAELRKRLFGLRVLSPSLTRRPAYDVLQPRGRNYWFDCVVCRNPVRIDLDAVLSEDGRVDSILGQANEMPIRTHFDLNMVGKSHDGGWPRFHVEPCAQCHARYLVYVGVAEPSNSRFLVTVQGITQLSMDSHASPARRVIEYSGTHTPADYIRGYRLASSPIVRFEGITMAMLFVAVVALLVSGPEVRARNGAILIVSTVLLMTFALRRTVLIPRMLARHFAQSSQATKPFVTRVDDDGLSTVQGTDSSSRRWSEFTGWKENGDYIVLREGKAIRIVPKRVFRTPADLDENAPAPGSPRRAWRMTSSWAIYTRSNSRFLTIVQFARVRVAAPLSC